METVLASGKVPTTRIFFVWILFAACFETKTYINICQKLYQMLRAIAHLIIFVVPSSIIKKKFLSSQSLLVSSQTLFVLKQYATLWFILFFYSSNICILLEIHTGKGGFKRHADNIYRFNL